MGGQNLNDLTISLPISSSVTNFTEVIDAMGTIHLFDDPTPVYTALVPDVAAAESVDLFGDASIWVNFQNVFPSPPIIQPHGTVAVVPEPCICLATL